MAQKGIIINTTTAGHVDAQDFAKIITGLTQTNACILNDGSVMTITKQSNNAIRLTAGLILMSNGVVIRVEDTEDIVIQSGTLGYERYDLLIAEYIKNGEAEGTDIARLRILQGEYASANPTKPTLINDDETVQNLIATMLVSGTEMTLKSTDVYTFMNGGGWGTLISNENVLTDCNSANVSGLFRGYGTISKHSPFSDGSFIVEAQAFDNTNIVQYAWKVGSSLRMKRTCSSGTWSDWAPMYSTVKNITLKADSWNGKFYTIYDSLITASSNQEILPCVNPAENVIAILQDANIMDWGQTAGSLTVKAYGTVPPSDMPIRVIFRGDI